MTKTSKQPATELFFGFNRFEDLINLLLGTCEESAGSFGGTAHSW